MIPPPYATVDVHGPGSWTVRIGWPDPADGLDRDVIGIIYDAETDPRVPGTDDNDPTDPKVVCWNNAGDVEHLAPGFSIDEVPDASALLDRLAANPIGMP